jgi:hypothetical protein
MKRSSIFWAIVLMGAGGLLLLNNMNVLRGNVWNYIWPTFLVFLGLWFIFSPLLFRGSLETRELAIPLEGATAAKVVFKHGAGTLTVRRGIPGQLVSGSFGGGVEDVVERKSDQHVKVVLKMADDIWVGAPWGYQAEGLAWDVALTDEVPLALKFETGASRSTVDLTDLKVVDLKVDTGASETDLNLPAAAGFTDAKVSCGAAKMTIRIPAGVAAHIHADAGLASVKVDSRFVKGTDGWESPEFATAVNKVDLKIETGVGSVEVI